MTIVKRFIHFFGGYITGFAISFLIIFISQFFSTYILPKEYYKLIEQAIFFILLLASTTVIIIYRWNNDKSFICGFLLGAIFYTISLYRGLA